MQGLELVLNHIDSVLVKWQDLRSRTRYDDYSDLPDDEVSELITLLDSAICRLSPHGSRYRENARTLIEGYSKNSNGFLNSLGGILKALKHDYNAGYLQSIEEIVHADVFSDFLEMAEHLLGEKYKDPAAVMVGGVLEEHLRKLCIKSGIQISENNRPKKVDRLNSDLGGKDVYTKLDQKSVTAWLDLRNKAAHGKYSEYTIDQVLIMLQGVRNFCLRHSA